MTITATRTCPECSVERPLHQFRRWHGAHRTLHQTCNVCHPETPIQDLPPREQERILALREAEQRTVERYRKGQEWRERQRRGVQASRMLKRHASDRIRNWNALVGTFARDERDYAKRREMEWRNNWDLYISASDAPRKRYLSNQHLASLTAKGFDLAPPWIAFFEQYAPLLERITEQIKNKSHNRETPVTPPEEETKLEYYLTPQEITHLKTLYIQCIPPKGVRQRVPWVITGGAPPRKEAVTDRSAERRERIARASKTERG